MTELEGGVVISFESLLYVCALWPVIEVELPRRNLKAARAALNFTSPRSTSISPLLFPFILRTVIDA